MKKIQFLGIKIDNFNKKESLGKIRDFLDSHNQQYIVTVNPEFLAETRKDKEFYHILNKADLSLADGFGIIFMSYFFPPKIKEHIRGSDLTRDILDLAEIEDRKVCILSWVHGLSTENDIKMSLSKKYPNLKFIIQEVDRQNPKIDFNKINEFSPQILLVALGAPYQEKVISKNLAQIPSVKVAMGIGGTLDFLTNKIKRAPKIMRKLELEWLWRLMKQPKTRFKRIFTAVVIFPLLVLREKFLKKN